MVCIARRNLRFSWFLSFIFLFATAIPAVAGTIVVRPGTLDHFLLTAPESAVAGESFLVRVEPYDSNGNLISEAPAKGSQFKIRVSGSAEASPDRIRPSDFAGGITVRVTNKVAETMEFAVLEGGAVTPLASVRVPVYPNKLDRFTVNAPRKATSGESFQVRIIARDAFDNAKTDLPDIRDSLQVDSMGTGTLRRVNRQLPPIRSGEMILSFEPVKVGKVRITVQEQTTHSRGESKDVEIRPAHLDHFIVQGPKAAVAGEKFTLLLSAMDRHDNLVTSYDGQGNGVLLLSSGSGLLEPPSVPPATFRSGQAKVNASYTAAGSLKVSVRETNGEMSGVSEPIVILPADPDHFVVTSPEEAVAGEAFPVEITAFDQYNNIIEDYDLRGLEVYLSTDGTGRISPSALSPSSFVKGKAVVEISYSKAESFSVIAALSKDDLEKIIHERTRRAPVPPAPAPLTPEEMALEKERELALQAREEALKARMEDEEEQQARDEALRAREEAQRARESAGGDSPVERPLADHEQGGRAVPVPPPPEPVEAPPEPVEVTSEPVEAPPEPAEATSEPAEAPPEPAEATSEPAEAPPEPAALQDGTGPGTAPVPPPVEEPVEVAQRTVQELTQVSLIESRGQAMVTLETSGPVSYNAFTGSARSKEWIFVEIFPVQRDRDRVTDLIGVESELIGEIQVEELEAEKVKVSLQVLPPAISYVVSQQDRAVVVKIIKNE